jgi:hypothetical protein
MRECLGCTLRETITRLDLGKADASYLEREPPPRIRGISFYFASNGWVFLFINRGDPIYGKEVIGDLDRESILDAIVGGIRLASEGNSLQFGDVPFPWSR